MTPVEIRFDIPKAEWWTQNQRLHWTAADCRKQAIRRRAALVARSWANRHPGVLPLATYGGQVHVTAFAHMQTHGRYDPENIAPTVKTIIDALTREGFWPDDNHHYLIGPDYRAGERSPRKGWYAITLRIEEEGSMSSKTRANVADEGYDPMAFIEALGVLDDPDTRLEVTVTQSDYQRSVGRIRVYATFKGDYSPSEISAAFKAAQRHEEQ